MNRTLWTTVVRAFRRTALPLVAYYAITLAIPLANGAAESGAFLEHALAVLLVPPVVILLACAVHQSGTHSGVSARIQLWSRPRAR